MMTDQKQQAMIDAEGLTIIRIFDAPRELVWQAWTEPEMIQHWWGPEGCTAPEIRVELRIGGNYFFHMEGNGFTHYHVGVYKEIVPQEKLVCTQCFSDADGNVVSPAGMGMPDMPEETLLSITFEDTSDGKTKMTFRHEGMPQEFGDMASGGWGQSFDKMAQLVESN